MASCCRLLSDMSAAVLLLRRHMQRRQRVSNGDSHTARATRLHLLCPSHGSPGIALAFLACLTFSSVFQVQAGGGSLQRCHGAGGGGTGG